MDAAEPGVEVGAEDGCGGEEGSFAEELVGRGLVGVGAGDDLGGTQASAAVGAYGGLLSRGIVGVEQAVEVGRIPDETEVADGNSHRARGAVDDELRAGVDAAEAVRGAEGVGEGLVVEGAGVIGGVEVGRIETGAGEDGGGVIAVDGGVEALAFEVFAVAMETAGGGEGVEFLGAGRGGEDIVGGGLAPRLWESRPRQPACAAGEEGGEDQDEEIPGESARGVVVGSDSVRWRGWDHLIAPKGREQRWIVAVRLEVHDCVDRVWESNGCEALLVRSVGEDLGIT